MNARMSAISMSRDTIFCFQALKITHIIHIDTC